MDIFISIYLILTGSFIVFCVFLYFYLLLLKEPEVISVEGEEVDFSGYKIKQKKINDKIVEYKMLNSYQKGGIVGKRIRDEVFKLSDELREMEKLIL